ncbi:MAG: hemolysin family protein [Nitriliruptoraceae bacterium]
MSAQSQILAAVAVALLALTAYLAAVETVVSRCNVVRALRLVEDHDDRSSHALLWLTEHRATALDALLTATVVARVALVTTVVVLAEALVDGAAGLLGAVALLAVASLVLGEVAPRTVALRHLEQVGLALARSARLVVRLLSPVAQMIVAVGRGLVPRRHEVSGPHASDDELRELEDDGHEQDEELEPEERAMIRSIFELPDTLVREIMQPRPDMVTVAADQGLAEVVATALEHGYSRLPVHDPQDPDSIVGVVYAKDLLRRVAVDPDHGWWEDLVRQATLVPEIKRVDELLRELQAGRVHLALVVDEYGELVGLVTIEDILEEIVGEIVDEHDHEEPLVEPLEGDRLRVDARLGVDDLNELLGTELPEEGWDTVGGLVFATLGRVPVEGEHVEFDGSILTVESVQGRRVGKVLVDPHGGSQDVGAADGSSSSADTS